MNKKILQVIVGGLVLYLASAGISYLVFNSVLKGPVSINTPFGNLTDITSVDEEGVKDRACPINGAMYTKAREEQWQKRRPLAVMIENHADSRPIIGLTRADVIYQAVAEGGITRHMAVFLCQDAGDIAPIRSARTYFLDWLSEYDALYAHVGGANTPGPANALGQIKDYGVYDMDQFGFGFPTYWRGTDKLAPHNVHSTTKKLWEAAAEREYGPEDDKGVRWDKDFQQWKFKEDEAFEKRGDQKPFTVAFWQNQPDYSETWQYDKTSNTYKKFYGQTAALDPLTNQNLYAKTLIIQFQTERDANDGYPDGHLLYDTTGTGKSLVFMDGKAIEGKWLKEKRISRTKFLDSKGKEIVFNRGLIWIETVPVGNTIDY